MAIASLTAGAPLTAFGGDREIADAIVSTLKQKQADGALKGFDIDLSVEDGKVVIGGTVANQAQLDSVLKIASITSGVKLVENKASVKGQNSAKLGNAKNVVMTASANDAVEGSPALIAEPNRFTEGSHAVVSPVDAGVTAEILGRLGSAQKNGHLRNFELDISTVGGEVWARGVVATPEQKQLVLKTAQMTPGVRKVIDDITVNGRVRPASSEVATPSSMPVNGSGVPRAFAPSNLAASQMPGGANCGPSYGGGGVSMQGGAGYGSGAPVPMQGGAGYGGGAPRYDQPNLPGYAWPTYAAYPNSAAVTYPKQYSASAWPYIGPFYPYPQVPLGWRKVALEWDDGLWYLDFTGK